VNTVDLQVLKRGNAPLVFRLEGTDALEGVVKKLQPQRKAVSGIEEIDDAASRRELAWRPDKVDPLVTSLLKPSEKGLSPHLFADYKRKEAAVNGIGSHQGTWRSKQNAALPLPPQETFAALDEQGFPDLLTRKGRLLENMDSLFAVKGAEIPEKIPDLSTVGKEDKERKGGNTADPGPGGTVSGDVIGRAHLPSLQRTIDEARRTVAEGSFRSLHERNMPL
jgi:hypothetical protein